MPIHSCTLPGGGSGFKWGSQGKCYEARSGAERQAEAAYAHGYAGDAALTAAGVLLVDGGRVYLAQRRDGAQWALPGGMVEAGEEPMEAALRELNEETGLELTGDDLTYLGTCLHDDCDFIAFVAFLDGERKPKLRGPEHTANGWFPITALPAPLHDGVERLVTSLPMARAMDCLAMDRQTVRTIDVDGRMRVEITNISKANVCPYYGREIPDHVRLGLDPNTKYMLLRDPVELAKAVESFNGIPLLSEHVPVTAANHKHQYVVGTTGTEACFEPPYLKNSLVIWEDSAIAGVETGEQKELSSAYRYVADMTPGEYEGVPYDGRMTNIIGNHVALVTAGRAGADVVVGDSKPVELTTMKKARTIALAQKAAIGAYLRPALAQDSAPIPFQNLVTQGATARSMAAKVKQHYKGKFDVNASELEAILLIAADEAEKEAKEAEDEDEEEDDEDEEAEDEEEDDEDEKKEAKDKRAKDRRAKDAEPEKEKEGMDKRAKDKRAKDKRAKDAGAEGPEDRAKDAEPKGASDAALIERGASLARKQFAALRQAEIDCRPLVGELIGMDSAEEIYKHTLNERGVDITGVHASAYPALVKVLRDNNGVTKAGDPTTIAMDADSDAEFRKLFPSAVAPKRA